MRKEFLIIAGFCLIVGIGLTAEVVDWNQNDYGPKNRKQTNILTIVILILCIIVGYLIGFK